MGVDSWLSASSVEEVASMTMYEKISLAISIAQFALAIYDVLFK